MEINLSISVLLWFREVLKAALDNDAKHIIISLGGIGSFDAVQECYKHLVQKFYDDEANIVDVKALIRLNTLEEWIYLIFILNLQRRDYN